MGITVETSQAKEHSPELTSAPVPSTHPLKIAGAHRRAQHNISQHWFRDAKRVLVLIAADLATYFALRTLVRGARDGLFGSAATDLATALFDRGFLGGQEFTVALVLSLMLVGAYGAGERRRDMGRVLSGAALAALMVLYQAAWQRQLAVVSLQFVATVAVVGTALVGVRWLVDRFVRRVRKNRPPSRAILVMHDGASWQGVRDHLFDVREFCIHDTIRLGDRTSGGIDKALKSLVGVIGYREADTVILWTDLNDEEFAYAVDVALASGCRLLAGPRTPATAGIQPKSVWVDGHALIELTAPRLQAWQLVVKRTIDIVGAALGLIVLSPVFAVLTAWIRLESAGPVFFSQTRLGRRGRPFQCLKFRSMRRDAEAMLTSDPELHAAYVENHFKLPAESDPRITRSGRFLRRTSLDELPQLINVVLGHMSLVGPRPIVPDEIEHYGGGAPLFLSLKPGVTGVWAVGGRSEIGYPDRARMELEYMRTWGLGTDLGILLRTLPAVMLRRGAH